MGSRVVVDVVRLNMSDSRLCLRALVCWPRLVFVSAVVVKVKHTYTHWDVEGKKKKLSRNLYCSPSYILPFTCYELGLVLVGIVVLEAKMYTPRCQGEGRNIVGFNCRRSRMA